MFYQKLIRKTGGTRSNVQQDVEELQEEEETKAWMGLESRTKLALATYPQLLQIIEHCWRNDFETVIRDKALVQEARHISHLRNAIFHMSDVPDEEIERVRQVLRDWFRVVSP